MREILNEIFTWSWYSEPHGYNFNGHLIRHAEGNLCIDPVEPGEEGLDEIARLGATRILLTNRNHSRGSNKVRSEPECPIGKAANPGASDFLAHRWCECLRRGGAPLAAPFTVLHELIGDPEASGASFLKSPGK